MSDVEAGLLETRSRDAHTHVSPGLRRGLTHTPCSAACVLADGVSHDQRDATRKTRNLLILALVISASFLVVEFVGGLYAHSLAILTDAAHLLSDVSGFAVSALATSWVAQASGSHFSFGFHRVEVLGALASVLSVWLVTGILVVEAVNRVRHPTPVDGKVMFILALIGVGVNVLLLWLLGGHHHGHGHSHTTSTHQGHSSSDSEDDDKHENGHAAQHGNHSHAHGHEHEGNHGCSNGGNINVRGAIIHVLGDIVQSVGVAVAGALIWWHQDDPRWHVADPICTFLFAGLVLWTTAAILRDISDILMERAPRGIDVGVVAARLAQIPGVQGVHDLHVWQLTPGIPLLAAHVEMWPGADPTAVLHCITRYCRGLGIGHSTVQLLVDGAACPCGSDSRHGSGVQLEDTG